MLIANILNIEESLIGFLLWLDSVGYNVFTALYRTFIKLASTKIFVNEAFDTLINNIYIVVGVVALFLFSVTLLRMMVDPDGADKGSKSVGDMIKRLLLAVILIVLVPTMFDFMYDFQNSIIAYNVIPNLLIGSPTTSIPVYDEDGNYIGTQEISREEATSGLLQNYANNMTVNIISGLMYPIDENGTPKDDITIDASPWFKGSTKAWILGGFCAAGIVVGVLSLGGGAGVTVLACGIAGTAGGLLSGVVADATAKEYTWSYAKAHMAALGDFSQITLFAEAIQQGDMHYSALISTFVVGFLVYMIASFCIDVVIRAAKLEFYQLVAPICLLMSVSPKQKDLLGKWFKVVMTTYFEIFIRIASMCAVAFLVGRINIKDLNLSIFHPIVSTFVICGIVLFAKQLPKIISDLTGINSGNMKLNLREKLAEGGAFAVGGVIAGGTKMLGRGLANTWKSAKSNYEYNANTGKYQLKAGKTWKNVAGAIVGGLGTTATGTLQAQIRSGINAKNAKSFKDMKNAKNTAVSQTESAQAGTHKYIASHGGTIQGIGKGLAQDAFQGFKNYIGAKDEILAKVKSEDSYVATFDDYEALYGDSGYKALDYQKDQYEAALAAGVGYGTMNVAQTQAALIQAKEKLTQKRMEAIATNLSGAGYVAYNLAKQVAEDPDMAKAIGASPELIRLAQNQDFVLKKDKSTGETLLYHKTGIQWTTDELTDLFEGHKATYTYAPNGKATMVTGSYTTAGIITPVGQELNQSKKDVKQNRNNDKNSVTYKQAIAEQNKSKGNN